MRTVGRVEGTWKGEMKTKRVPWVCDAPRLEEVVREWKGSSGALWAKMQAKTRKDEGFGRVQNVVSLYCARFDVAFRRSWRGQGRSCSA